MFSLQLRRDENSEWVVWHQIGLLKMILSQWFSSVQFFMYETRSSITSLHSFKRLKCYFPIYSKFLIAQYTSMNFVVSDFTHTNFHLQFPLDCHNITILMPAPLVPHAKEGWLYSDKKKLNTFWEEKGFSCTTLSHFTFHSSRGLRCSLLPSYYNCFFFESAQLIIL
jgi:hypothetical protein